MTEETRRKISESRKGQRNHHVPHADESKKKISESCKGKHHIPHTEETKKKIAEAVHLAAVKKHHTEETKFIKAVHVPSLEEYPGTWIKNA